MILCRPSFDGGCVGAIHTRKMTAGRNGQYKNPKSQRNEKREEHSRERFLDDRLQRRGPDSARPRVPRGGRKGGCSLLWCGAPYRVGGRSRPRRRARSAPRGGYTRRGRRPRWPRRGPRGSRGRRRSPRARGRGRPPPSRHPPCGRRRAPHAKPRWCAPPSAPRAFARSESVRRHPLEPAPSRSRARDALRRTSRRASGDRRPGRHRVSRGPR